MRSVAIPLFCTVGMTPNTQSVFVRTLDLPPIIDIDDESDDGDPEEVRPPTGVSSSQMAGVQRQDLAVPPHLVDGALIAAYPGIEIPSSPLCPYVHGCPESEDVRAEMQAASVGSMGKVLPVPSAAETVLYPHSGSCWHC